MRPRTIAITVAGSVALVAAMAYGSSLAARQQEADRRETVTMAEAMLQAFDADDYAAFAAGFTDNLRADMDRGAFEAWRAPLADTLGGFIAINGEEDLQETPGKSVRHVFDAVFEHDDHVRFVIVLTTPGRAVKRVELQPGR